MKNSTNTYLDYKLQMHDRKVLRQTYEGKRDCEKRERR